MMGFEEFEPIYGEPKAEWAKNSDSGSVPLRRFLMHVFSPDYYHLKIHVTDFHSNAFETVKSIMQLEDMITDFSRRNSLLIIKRRDITGIGGSWSEFVEYIIASVKSEDVKLVLDKHSDSDGPACAKLVAQKSKGMPVISFSLTKLADSATYDAMENLSFGLFEALKRMQNSAARDKESSSQLTKVISIEKGRSIQSQSEKRQKFEKMNSSDQRGALASLSSNGLQDSPDKQSARDPASKKVINRVVPAYRRAKTRGAFLQDIEEDEGS